METIRNRILKSELVEWRKLVWMQASLKDLTKKDFQKLKRSLLNNGFIAPFHIWNDLILDGHHRQKAMQELEAEGCTIPDLLPADFIDCKDDAEAAKFVLIYSSIFARTTEEGLYQFLHDHQLDFGTLKKEIDLPDFSLPTFEAGYLRDGNDAQDETTDRNERAAELLAKWDVHRGDLWKIGQHHLMCGDSRNLADVEKLFRFGECNFTVTDPPYGVGFKYMDFDDSSNAENLKLVQGVFELFPQKRVWTCGRINLGRDLNWNPKAKWLVWHVGFQSARSGLGGASTVEPIIVANITGGTLPNDYLNFPTDRIAGLLERHACPKPVSLYQHLIEHLTQGAVADPFAGSGTTMIACENLQRKCYAMEISPAYVAVALDRMKALFPEITINKIDEANPI